MLSCFRIRLLPPLRLIKRLFAGCLALLCIFGLQAQNNRVDAWIDTNRIMIGDQAHLNIRILYAAGTRATTDMSAWEGLQGLEVIQQTPWDTLQEASVEGLQKIITITSFDSGTCIIPPLMVRFEADGIITEIPTPEMRLEVQTPPVANLAPIRDIVPEGITWEDFLPFILGGIVFLALIYGISRWKNREKKVPPPPTAPEIPLEEQTRRRLEALRDRQLWQKGEIKAYETELTYIIRDYLKKKYEVPALEATTGELPGLLRDKGISQAAVDDIVSILEIADLVKFAQWQPHGDIYDKAMDKALGLVA